jgi:transposase
MQDITKFVGLDVSKDSIAVAIADEGREAPRYFGQVPNNRESIRKFITKLTGDNGRIKVCYEAGPTGLADHGH